ncbi:MAG: hypothetical protein ACKOYM_02785 [Actinomycetes bacterium]
MRAVADVGRLLLELLRYGIATRRVLFPVVIALSLVLVVTVAVVKVVVPVVIYPLL